MTIIQHEDGSQSLFYAGDNPTFEILTWCSDPDGQKPEQVHLIIQVTPEFRILYRFTGPKVLTRLIDALTIHANDVWGGLTDY